MSDRVDRQLARRRAPYSLEEQLCWTELPRQEEFGEAAAAVDRGHRRRGRRAVGPAHAGSGGKPVAPASASKPVVNLFTRGKPAIATVQGNFRITAAGSSSDVRHIVLSFGATVFPVLEGQSIGIVAPGTQSRRPPARYPPLFDRFLARRREAQRQQCRLTVKRAEGGVASNYLCDLKVGDKVHVTGPFGATFLMPNDPNSSILMICTGTGSAPFRAFTERRRRAAPGAPGKLMMFFGARTPQELPYFGPLQKVPERLLEKHLVFSRLPGKSKEYVQDRMRAEADTVADLLTAEQAHIFICGLQGMEAGVEDALDGICRHHGLDWNCAQAADARIRSLPCRNVLRGVLLMSQEATEEPLQLPARHASQGTAQAAARRGNSVVTIAGCIAFVA